MLVKGWRAAVSSRCQMMLPPGLAWQRWVGVARVGAQTAKPLWAGVQVQRACSQPHARRFACELQFPRCML